ncbi:MAG: hypothetical protein R3192_05480 [Woeseiaceae bacterium]|nr:hypothetical protein [Woeseiaceae bacterium]
MSAKKKDKKKKDSFAVRLKRHGREFLNLGRLLVNEPRKFPAAFLGLIRRSLRTVWDARGGSLYACGYVLTFVWLEVTMFIDDIATADSVSGFLGAQLFELIFRYFSESLANMVMAFIWPAFVIQIAPPWGLIALVIAFVSFDKLFKKPIEGWLLDDDTVPDRPEPQSSSAGDDA